MSVINKKPYIQKVIESLSQENLEDLQTLVNGATSTLFRSFINPSYVFTEEDKGVAHCVLETPDDVYTGYLIYTDTYCVLVCYNGDKTQKMFTLKLDYENKKYSIVDEDLNINEFRRIVENHITNLEVDNNDVVANPDGSATAELNTVKIDGVIFGLGGGQQQHLYRHSIRFNTDNSGQIAFDIINNNGLEMTLNDVISYLATNGYLGGDTYNNSKILPATGGFQTVENGLTSIYLTNNIGVSCVYTNKIQIWKTGTSITLTDGVVTNRRNYLTSFENVLDVNSIYNFKDYFIQIF